LSLPAPSRGGGLGRSPRSEGSSARRTQYRTPLRPRLPRDGGVFPFPPQSIILPPCSTTSPSANSPNPPRKQSNAPNPSATNSPRPNNSSGQPSGTTRSPTSPSVPSTRLVPTSPTSSAATPVSSSKSTVRLTKPTNSPTTMPATNGCDHAASMSCVCKPAKSSPNSKPYYAPSAPPLYNAQKKSEPTSRSDCPSPRPRGEVARRPRRDGGVSSNIPHAMTHSAQSKTLPPRRLGTSHETGLLTSLQAITLSP